MEKKRETGKIHRLFKSNKNRTGDRTCQIQKIIEYGQIAKPLERHDDQLLSMKEKEKTQNIFLKWNILKLLPGFKQ